MFDMLEQEGFVRNAKQTAQRLAERERQGGLGIPGTAIPVPSQNEEIVTPFSKFMI